VSAAGTTLQAEAAWSDSAGTALVKPDGTTFDVDAILAANSDLGALAPAVQALINNSLIDLAAGVNEKVTAIGGDISQTTGDVTPDRIPFTSGPATGLTLEEAVADLYARTQASGATAPVGSGAPTLAFPGGSADVGETATITQGTYSSGTVLSRNWDVKVNGSIVSNTTATTFTVPTGADAGQRALAVTENAVWANGVVTQTSITYTVNVPAQVTVPVALTAPSITGTTAADTSTLTGVHGSYSGASVSSYTYRWLRDGVAIGAATSQTYAKTSNDWGRLITFEETPTNSAGTGAANTSAGLAVLSSTPTTAFLLIDNSTITRLQTRLAAGQFKASNDAFSGSPGDGNRIIANAAVAGLESDPGPISTANHGQYVQYGRRTRDRALLGVVQNNSTYRTTAISELLTILANANLDISLYNFTPTADGHATDGMVSQAYFGIRMLWTYALLKPYMSAPNISTAESKFNQWGAALQTYYANRYTNVTNPRINGPSGVWYGGDPSQYAYITGGTLTHQLSTLSVTFNNRASGTIALLGLLGVQMSNATWKASATTYFTDMLKYMVFPDGSTAEYTRNGDYSTPQQGLRYNAVNILSMIYFAEAMRLAGDSSIYSLSTTEGKDGSAGTAKTLSLMISTDFDVRRKIKSWYSASGGAGSPETIQTHIGTQVDVVAGATGTDSTHFIGIAMAKTGLPSLASTIQGCTTGDTTNFSGLEPFPGLNGATVDSGGNVTTYEDCMGVIPGPLLFYSDNIAAGGGGSGGGTIPTVVGTATTTAASTLTPSISKPTAGVTVAVGDDLYLITSNDSNLPITGPSGFTLVGSGVATAWLDQQYIAVWYRRATSSDVSATTYSYVSPNADNVGVMFVVRGAFGVGTLTSATDTNANVGYATGVGNISAPSASAGVNNLVVRILCGELSAAGTVTYPAPSPAQTVIAGADSGSYSSVKAYYASQTLAGVTGAVTSSAVTFTGGGTVAGIGLTLVIAPA
jgi:hypothetical protein